MENKEQEKVEIKLERHLWPDERKALQEKKKKKYQTVLLFCLTFLLISSSLFIGFYLGNKGTIVLPTTGHTSSDSLQRFESVYQTLLENWYFLSDVENAEDKLIERAIAGMIGTDIDPHTSYMSKEEAESFVEGIDMGFVGIGIQYSVLEDSVLIERVFYNSPADKGGLVPGDRIVAVDGKNVSGWTTEQLQNAVKGEKGSVVRITYLRQNEQKDVDVIRDTVENSIYGEIKEDVGYLQIYQFSSAAPQVVEDYLSYFKQNNITKLLIDVRDDGGGFLNSLIGVANLFLNKGQIILSQQYSDGEAYSVYADGESLYHDYFNKIVILGNDNSASASEALIGALTQNNKATFVGITTYGKSSIQVPSYYADGSALKYTHGMWMTPDGSVINGVGITPDVEVLLHPVLEHTILTLAEDETYQYDQVHEDIMTIQLCLDFLDYDIDRTDGYFSEGTRAAVLKFQRDYQLNPTGRVDDTTASLLCAEVTRLWNAFPDKYDLQMNKALEILHE